jgi:signal transduction histidine kinase
MLNRAVGNLLSNALRHGRTDCTVTVKAVARGDGSAEIEVANPGSGIAAEHLPRIFDRFYRPCSSREESSAGSGLGLAIVKSIAELHGGRVGVRSEPPDDFHAQLSRGGPRLARAPPHQSPGQLSPQP